MRQNAIVDVNTIEEVMEYFKDKRAMVKIAKAIRERNITGPYKVYHWNLCSIDTHLFTVCYDVNKKEYYILKDNKAVYFSKTSDGIIMYIDAVLTFYN